MLTEQTDILEKVKNLYVAQKAEVVIAEHALSLAQTELVELRQLLERLEKDLIAEPL